MKTDSLGQTLEQSLNNPELWIRQAEQQFLVAEEISPNIRNRSTTQIDTLLHVGYLKTTALLLALSIENSFKAIKASKNEFKVNSKGFIAQTRGGGRSGHSLCELAIEVSFALSSNQIVLLEKLTEIGIWAGKYHTPIRHCDFEKANIKSPKSLTLPNDLITVKEIIIESAKLSKIPSVIANFKI